MSYSIYNRAQIFEYLNDSQTYTYNIKKLLVLFSSKGISMEYGQLIFIELAPPMKIILDSGGTKINNLEGLQFFWL
jgi:hypothetical protein